MSEDNLFIKLDRDSYEFQNISHSYNRRKFEEEQKRRINIINETAQAAQDALIDKRKFERRAAFGSPKKWAQGLWNFAQSSVEYTKAAFYTIPRGGYAASQSRKYYDLSTEASTRAYETDDENERKELLRQAEKYRLAAKDKMDSAQIRNLEDLGNLDLSTKEGKMRVAAISAGAGLEVGSFMPGVGAAGQATKATKASKYSVWTSRVLGLSDIADTAVSGAKGVGFVGRAVTAGVAQAPVIAAIDTIAQDDEEATYTNNLMMTAGVGIGLNLGFGYLGRGVGALADAMPSSRRVADGITETNIGQLPSAVQDVPLLPAPKDQVRVYDFTGGVKAENIIIPDGPDNLLQARQTVDTLVMLRGDVVAGKAFNLDVNDPKYQNIKERMIDPLVERINNKNPDAIPSISDLMGKRVRYEASTGDVVTGEVTPDGFRLDSGQMVEITKDVEDSLTKGFVVSNDFQLISEGEIRTAQSGRQPFLLEEGKPESLVNPPSEGYDPQAVQALRNYASRNPNDIPDGKVYDIAEKIRKADGKDLVDESSVIEAIRMKNYQLESSEVYPAAFDVQYVTAYLKDPTQYIEGAVGSPVADRALSLGLKVNPRVKNAAPSLHKAMVEKELDAETRQAVLDVTLNQINRFGREETTLHYKSLEDITKAVKKAKSGDFDDVLKSIADVMKKQHDTTDFVEINAKYVDEYRKGVDTGEVKSNVTYLDEKFQVEEGKPESLVNRNGVNIGFEEVDGKRVRYVTGDGVEMKGTVKGDVLELDNGRKVELTPDFKQRILENFDIEGVNIDAFGDVKSQPIEPQTEMIEKSVSENVETGNIPKSKPDLRINDTDVWLSGEIAEKVSKLKADHKKYVDQIKKQKVWTGGQTKDEVIKGESMKLSAELRRLTGQLTPTEKKNLTKRLSSNYVGKAVVVDGVEGQISGTPSFGKYPIKFVDGSTGNFKKDEFQSKFTTQELLDKELTVEGVSTQAPNVEAKFQTVEPLVSPEERNILQEFKTALIQGEQIPSEMEGRVNEMFERAGMKLDNANENAMTRSVDELLDKDDVIRFDNKAESDLKDYAGNATRLKEYENIVRKYFSEDEVGVNFEANIRTPQGQKALGVYYDKMIKFAKDANETTPEHEVLHAYFDLFTAPERKTEVLAQVKKQQGLEGDIEAEEWLADAFVDFARDNKKAETLPEKIREMFTEVWEGVKKLVGKEDKVRNLYKDIVDLDRSYVKKADNIESKRFKSRDPLLEEARKYESAEEFVNSQIVYHGTGEEFDKFDVSKGGEITEANSATKAIFFTDSKDVAVDYSIYAAEAGPIVRLNKKYDQLEEQARKESAKGNQQKADSLMQEADDLLAQIEELEDYDATRSRRERANVKEVGLSGVFKEVDAKGKTPQELADDNDVDSWLALNIDQAKEEGFDGVKFVNLDDTVTLPNAISNHYAVFNVDSIKTKSELEQIWEQANTSKYQVQSDEVDAMVKQMLGISEVKSNVTYLDEKLAQIESQGVRALEAFNTESVKLDRVQTDIDILQGELKKHPGKALQKYTLRKEGELPEIGDLKTMWGRNSDDISRALGFEDENAAIDAYNQYKDLKADLQALKDERSVLTIEVEKNKSTFNLTKAERDIVKSVKDIDTFEDEETFVGSILTSYDKLKDNGESQERINNFFDGFASDPKTAAQVMWRQNQLKKPVEILDEVLDRPVDSYDKDLLQSFVKRSNEGEKFSVDELSTIRDLAEFYGFEWSLADERATVGAIVSRLDMDLQRQKKVTGVINKYLKDGELSTATRNNLSTEKGRDLITNQFEEVRKLVDGEGSEDMIPVAFKTALDEREYAFVLDEYAETYPQRVKRNGGAEEALKKDYAQYLKESKTGKFSDRSEILDAYYEHVTKEMNTLVSKENTLEKMLVEFDRLNNESASGRPKEIDPETLAFVMEEASRVERGTIELGEVETEVRKIMGQLQAEGYTLLPEKVVSTPSLDQVDEAIANGVAPDRDVSIQAHEEYVKTTGTRLEVDKMSAPQKEQRFFKRVAEEKEMSTKNPVYTEQNVKQAEEYASRLVDTDLEAASRVAKRLETTGDPLQDAVVAQRYAGKMFEIGNIEEATDVVTKISMDATNAGKFIRGLRDSELVDPATAVRKVVDAKRSRVKNQVEQEMPRAKKDLSDIQVNKDMLSKILDDLTCK